ncbi:MAG: hypothetical protein JSR26_04990 [Proteobacteria bacterium]|nr:hypothetical protein [Pseudomonadota bacterium]
MTQLLDASPEKIELLRTAIRREDPLADVRGGSRPGAVEVASELSSDRVAAIMTGVLGMPVRSREDSIDECADGEGCCGCCGQ